MIAEQPDLNCVLVEVGGREPPDALPKHRTSDSSRVDLVGLAGLTFAATRDSHQLRRDPDHSLARGNQRLLEVVGKVATILYRPHQLLAQRSCPPQSVEMALLLRRDFPLAQQLARRRVDGRECVGALVYIRSDHDHPARPFNRWFSFDWTVGGQAFLGAVATLLLGHAAGPGWWRTTQRASVRPGRPTDRLRVSPSPAQDPTRLTGRHSKRHSFLPTTRPTSRPLRPQTSSRLPEQARGIHKLAERTD